MIKQVIKAELAKYLLEVKIYYADHLVGMLLTLIIFTVFSLSSSEQSGSFYIGFLYWYLLSSLVTEASTSISMEKQLGTLEQLLIKPIPFEGLITIKTGVWYLVNTIKVSCSLGLLVVILQLPWHFHWLLLPIFLLTSVGVFGFTLVLVALTLKYTKVASFENLISYLLLFLTGAILPLEKLPAFIQKVGQCLPITMGIDISKTLLDKGELDKTALILLILQSILYLALGYLCFHLIYQSSKKAGIDRNY